MRVVIISRPPLAPPPRAIMMMATEEVPYEGLSNRELKRMLVDRGVSTAGLFERDEFIRLLESAPPPSAASSSSSMGSLDLEEIAPVAEMTMQELMYELEERGVDFDVLAPQPKLAALLRQPRSRRAKRSGGDDGDGGGDAPDWRPTRGASPHTELMPLVSDAIGSVIDWAAPAVETVVEQVSPAASKAAAKASEVVMPRSKGVVAAVRAQLKKRLKPPPKPILLLLCLSALKYGLVKTALVALAVKLAFELALEARQQLLRLRSTPGRDRRADEGGPAQAA